MHAAPVVCCASHIPASQITHSSSSRMRVINHNWSATKQRPHLQSVAEISRHSVLPGDRIRQFETSLPLPRIDTMHRTLYFTTSQTHTSHFTPAPAITSTAGDDEWAFAPIAERFKLCTCAFSHLSSEVVWLKLGDSQKWLPALVIGTGSL